MPGDFLTALLAEAMLGKEPGATILYDVRASRAVPRHDRRPTAAAPVVNRVGHAFFKTRMREENAAFGGEVSGHYYFRDFWCADSGVIPALLVLELLSKREQDDVGAARSPTASRYFISGEINSEVEDQDAKMRGARRALLRRRGDAGSTASRSTTTTGTSTCARRTRSRCCG